MDHSRRDRQPRAHAHRAEGAGVEPLARLHVGEHGARDVHRVRAFGHQHVLRLEPVGDLAQGAVVAHRLAVVLEHRLDRGLVLGRALAELDQPLVVRRQREGLRVERLVQLRCHRPRVADQADLGRHVRADLLRVEVDLEHANALLESGRQPEVEDPVEPGADQQDDVRVLQCEGAGRGDEVGIVVGDDALAHRRRQHGKVRALDEAAHLALGAGVGRALADDDQRVLRLAQDGDRALDVPGIGERGGRLRAAGRELDVLLVDLGGQDVVRQVQVGGAGPAVDRRADRLLHVKGRPVRGVDLRRVLRERPRRLDLGALLERALAVLVAVVGAA